MNFWIHRLLCLPSVFFSLRIEKDCFLRVGEFFIFGCLWQFFGGISRSAERDQGLVSPAGSVGAAASQRCPPDTRTPWTPQPPQRLAKLL